MREKSPLGQSFAFAFRGVLGVIKRERNMRIHLAASLVVIAAAAFFSFSRLEWGILLLTIAMVMVAETVNTAVEAAVDLKSADRHPLAAKAKDTAAGAVLLAALFAVAIGVLLFGPRLYLLLKS